MHLLALLKAESGLNPRAERWGTLTAWAKESILLSAWVQLQDIIDRIWPDISFGYSQRIVLYHDEGDRSATYGNCLAVRQQVFEHPELDIRAAAQRLKGCFAQSSDGSALGAMTVYNSGADRRDDPIWMLQWRENVASYQRALEWAEQYREEA